MGRGRWQPWVWVVLGGLGFLTWHAAAQPPTTAPPAAPAADAGLATDGQSNPSLLAADQAVLDATAEVAGTQRAATKIEEVVVAPTTVASPPDLGDSQITIYADGQALVRRAEMVQLTVGRNEFELNGIARALVDGSALLRPVDGPARFTVLEQRSTLAPPAADLLQAALGREIEVRADDRTVRGTLVAIDDDGVTLSNRDGLLVHPPGTVVLPADLLLNAAQAKLTWALDTDQAGSAQVEATYLSGGFGWAADYALTILPQSQLTTLAAWVTLRNTSGLDLDDVGVQLSTAEAAKAGEPGAAVSYVPRPIDLANGGARRVLLAQSSPRRGAARWLVRVGTDNAVRVESGVRLANVAAQGLGVPLPPGPVRIYRADAQGRVQLVGQRTLAASAPGAALTWAVPADAALAPSAEVAPEVNGPVTRRVLTLHNPSADEALVTVVQALPPSGGQVIAASHTFTAPAGLQLTTDLTVPPNGRVEVRYQVRTQPAAEVQTS